MPVPTDEILDYLRVADNMLYPGTPPDVETPTRVAIAEIARLRRIIEVLKNGLDPAQKITQQ